MKRILRPVALVALLLSLAAGLATAQPTTTTTKKTASSATTKKPAPAATKTAAPAPKKAASVSAATPEQDLRTFSNWVDEKLEMPMANVRLDWGALQSEYARMTKRLDGAVDSLSVQSKREYLGQKARYKAWAAEQNHPVAETAGPGGNAADELQRKLLNTSAPINRAAASALPDLYGRLIEAARAKGSSWSKPDWEAANLVLGRLNDRYNQVGDQLVIEERVRIRSLQAEFKTLEKARDLKGILDGL